MGNTFQSEGGKKMVWNPLKSQNAVRLYTYSLVGSKATKCGYETFEIYRPRRQRKVSENIFMSFPKILKGNSNFTILYLPIVSEIPLLPNRTQVYHQKSSPTVFIKMWLGLSRRENGPVWPSERTIKKLTEQYEKSENDPMALQSVEQIVGKVLKQLNEEKITIKLQINQDMLQVVVNGLTKISWSQDVTTLSWDTCQERWVHWLTTCLTKTPGCFLFWD